MSASGLTVHEANLEEDIITFEGTLKSLPNCGFYILVCLYAFCVCIVLAGFPWILRLRYIMENAASLSEAHTLWASTNNTVRSCRSNNALGLNVSLCVCMCVRVCV